MDNRSTKAVRGPASGDRSHPEGASSRIVARLFVVAAVVGSAHGVVSLYWASGGVLLIETVSVGIRSTFEQQLWMIGIIGLFKLVAAMAPLLLLLSGWPWRRFWRTLCWAGSILLVTWGGLTSLIGNLVLSGLLIPESGVWDALRVARF